MQKDDAPVVWKTPTPNESQPARVGQLASPPFPMGTNICCTICTSAHHPQTRESEQTTVARKETSLPILHDEAFDRVCEVLNKVQ